MITLNKTNISSNILIKRWLVVVSSGYYKNNISIHYIIYTNHLTTYICIQTYNVIYHKIKYIHISPIYTCFQKKVVRWLASLLLLDVTNHANHNTSTDTDMEVVTSLESIVW